MSQVLQSTRTLLSQPSAPSRLLFWWLLLALLIAADGVSTWLGISFGFGEEAYPMSAAMLDAHGWLGLTVMECLMLALVAVILAGALWLDHMRVRWGVEMQISMARVIECALIAGVLVRALVVVSNVGQITIGVLAAVRGF